MADVHVPVLLERIVDVLSGSLGAPGAIYVDGTLGLGGHARAVLARNPHARLIGIDRDTDALAVARERLAEYEPRITLVHAVYDELPDVLDSLGIPEVDAILLDLGLSSLQIDRAGRGFAYRFDAPLDMRMNQEDPLTAADVLNTYSVGELARILTRYGEERYADRIARAIVAQRPFENSGRLVEVIQSALPAAARHSGGHPAKRTFQALRIEVNRELEALEKVLPTSLDRLRLHGRVAVLSYHSLEDRLVKRAFAAAASDRAPQNIPVVPDHLRAQFVLETRGAERPTVDETSNNSRAASARLRIAKRIREKA
ncbi:16S rRNA (cytosine(1402)-N(4))-methyltransferase RsmH [Tessaracoccus sp. OH4464_COT-324]|uniref:16S rRNA (cytosine(1402)-N(4))-methyltransferase RsmH n=1 Tax=Tessaracoccus sp. OH4464_COT-324 TaxID=2491059 RepID=UPI000F640592|nr:16S rRNA (cytosine(1402)-N(4))-methyltransferase RsmH [Tessaracoccus sp. OH4464_COT-324]RRD47550.1 16S rRNA (cytosine(1402)-N(4))-methyltransferase RsmH [Tessaracoccus sp. OH4464_COT-324]